MKYSKFVIIAATNFDNRIAILFSIKELLQQGIQVEYWDVSKITYNYASVLNDNGLEVPITIFETKDNFRKKVQACIRQDFLYLVFMNFCPQTAIVFRELTRINATMSYCVNGCLPLYQKTFLERLKGVNLSISIPTRWYMLLKRTGLYKPVDYLFSTCGSAICDYKVGKNTIVVPYNSTDYISSRRECERLVQDPYIVFIDINYPFHPDNEIVKWKTIPADEYYSIINAFFDKLEYNTGCKVVIAAHPSAVNYKKQIYFNGRDVFFLKTQQLIKYSEGVIDHCSTAVSYAIIYNKPVITVYSDSIKKSTPQLYEFSVAFQESINSNMVNVEHMEHEDVCFKPIDKEAYRKYLYDYITNKSSEEMNNSDIIISVLNGDL